MSTQEKEIFRETGLNTVYSVKNKKTGNIIAFGTTGRTSYLSEPAALTALEDYLIKLGRAGEIKNYKTVEMTG